MFHYIDEAVYAIFSSGIDSRPYIDELSEIIGIIFDKENGFTVELTFPL